MEKQPPLVCLLEHFVPALTAATASFLSRVRVEAPTVPCPLRVIMLKSKSSTPYTSQESIMRLEIRHECPCFGKIHLLQRPAVTAAFVYNTVSRAFFLLLLFLESKTTMCMLKWFILIKHLMHVYSCQDRITLFIIHVNSEVGISNHLRF